jgi:DNA repair protein RadC
MTEYTKQRLELRIVRDAALDKRYKQQIQSSADAERYLAGLESEATEKFVAMFLSVRHEILALSVLFSGGMAEAVVDTKVIIKAALDIGAATILVAHNHPSGDPAPSEADISLTRCIRDAAKLFNIRLLDHLIIGRERTYSFVACGLLVN